MKTNALITGDWHLDNFTSFSKVDPATGLSQRAVELLEVVEGLGDYAEEANCQFFIMLGDMFHKSNIPVPLYNATYDVVRGIARKVEHVIILKGNHDFYDRKGDVTSVHSFRDIATVVEHPATIFSIGGKRCTFIPYTDSVDQWREWVAKADGDYLFTHMDIQGVSYSGFERESTTGITQEDFLKGFDLSFTGHIHQPQCVGGTGYIVGAPAAHSFKDAGAFDRRCLILDDLGGVESVETDYNSFQKVQVEELHPSMKNGPTYLWVMGLDRDQYEDLSDWDNVIKKERTDRVEEDERTNLSTSSTYEEIVNEYLVYKGLGTEDEDYGYYQARGLQALQEGGAGARLMSSHLKDIEVEVKNWFGFGNSLQRFECTPKEDGLGLVRIKGINKTSKARSNNGAGKTSIRKTLVQGFYGVSGKVQNIQVVNESAPEGEEALLRVTFTGPDGRRTRVERIVSQKGRGTLKFEHQEDGEWIDISRRRSSDTQRAIEDYIGLSREAFEVSISFDGETSYAGATPTEKDEILNQLVGLHGYDKVYQWVKSVLTDVEDHLDELEDESSKLEISRTHVERELEGYENKKQEAEDRYSEALKRHKKQVARAERQVEKTQSKIRKKTGERERVLDEIEALCGKVELFNYEELKQEWDRLDEIVTTLSTSLALNEGNQADLRKKCKRAERTKGKVVCPTCFTEVDSAHLQDVVKGFKEDLEELKEEAANIKTQMEETRDKLSKVETDIRQHASFDREIERKSEKADLLRGSISTLEDVLESQKENLQELEESPPEMDEVGSFEAEIAEATDRLRKLAKTHKRLERQSRKQRREREILEFWKEGFSPRGIRNLLLDSVMDDLNRLSRRYSNILTAGETEVLFTSQTELASGEKRNKPDIEVRDVYGGSAYTLSSGGETRRINMIVDLAIHSLASRRYRTGFIFMDEVFTRLDERGQELTMELLNSILDEIPTIYIISNQEAINAYPFDNEITVVREGKQTRIEG